VLLGDTGGARRGTKTIVGLGCPKEYGECMLVLHSFRACDFHVFFSLHTTHKKTNQIDVKFPLR
jgi:hypothetical protein